MYKGKTTLGVITARGGSKGIPRKNIKLLAGKPLIAYTIEAAHASKCLTHYIVSTDDEEIATIARSLHADVPFMRPVELAQDRSASIEVIQHALKWFRDHKGREFDYVMILQPTSPLRSGEDIDACITKIIDTGADSVMSMVKLTDFALEKLKRIDDDLILSLDGYEEKILNPRHELERVYRRNCAVYLVRTEFAVRGDLFGRVSRPYIMPPGSSIDINEPVDFEFAEFLLKKFLLHHK